MNNNFPKLAMARFSEQFKNQSLISMHATNPQPFTQIELENTIERSFNDIIQNVDLGFATDQGSADLRDSIANNLYENITPDDVIAHAGAQEALFCAFYALLKAGDKVLAIAPVYEPLSQIPINIGCEVNYIHLNPDYHWSLDLNQIEAQFKRGCKLLIINFPHNPTGAMITETELFAIIALCEKYDVWLLSDEVFRGLEHELKIRLPAVADLYTKGISIGVLSKAYAIPGLRIGWLVCQDAKLRERVLDVKGYLSICNSQVDESLASIILQLSDKILNRNLNIIMSNKLLLQNIKSIFGEEVQMAIPNAGCCVFAQIKNTIKVDEFVRKIANKHQYLLYPAYLFETKINAIRIGFGSRSFEEFCNQL